MNCIKRPVAVAIMVALSAGVNADVFNRIATFPIANNLPQDKDHNTKTVAEIVVSADHGNTLVYTDSKLEAIGLVNISNASAPKAAGIIDLSGEPTSVAVKGKYAFAGVNTSESYTAPSGHVSVIDIQEKSIAAKCDVQGQPDSVALSPDGRYLAIAVENERDEDLNDGVIPQLPAGHLAIFNLTSDGELTNCEKATLVEMTGIAEVAPGDPEPEYVDINGDNIAVVTLQENNHIALVDLASGRITHHFPAGKTSLSNIDTSKGGNIQLTGGFANKAREPDAVAWLDNAHFATADEGDYEGGSRTFTVYNTQGDIVFDSGNALEHLATAYGHFPKERAHKKGSEPEGIAAATFAGSNYVFIGLERAGLVAVYKQAQNGRLELAQGLPAGWRPEGITAIPNRNLLVVANEKDKPKKGDRSTIMLYEYGNASPSYPQIKSNILGKAPIGWGALSALSADHSAPNTLYTVNDSFYKSATIYTVDVSSKPARITEALKVNVDNLDVEGIAQDTDGTFWVASEGKPANRKKNKPEIRKNRILHIDAQGNLIEEIKLPPAILNNVKKHGLEGIALDQDKVLVAFQRAWKDDPKGIAKIGEYNRSTKSWGFYAYPLDAPESSRGGWIGLSEITTVAPGKYQLIERDNQRGVYAAVKRIYSIDTNGIRAGDAGSELPRLQKTLVKDVLAQMNASNGWTPDKLEGLAVTSDGRAYLVTDNDGVDGNSGETLFWEMKR